MGDTPITDLQDAWPGKAIWCNFPESLFLEDDSVIYDAALDLMHNAYSRGRFILGITEDFPEDRMEHALAAIARAIADYERP